mgnify:CR=1 FL=1
MSVFNKISELPLPFLNHWGYLLVFVFSFLETIPFVGLFVPGQTAIIVAGFFAQLGILNIFYLIVIASIGAVFGDFFGYAMGRRYGAHFINKTLYEKTKRVINRHVGKTLLFGRFNSLTRAFTPFVAGASNVPLSTFTFFTIIGGILWAVSFSLLGYFLGQSYTLVAPYVGRFIFLATIIAVSITVTYYLVNKHRHIFKRYHLYTLFLNLFSLYLLSKSVDDVLGREILTRLDHWVSDYIFTIADPFLTGVSLLITNIFSPLNIVICSLLFLAILAYRRKWYDSALLLLGVGGGTALEYLLKILIARPRPIGGMILETGYSFPSAHATLALIFFSMLIYSFRKDIKNIFLRSTFIAANILMILLVGLSRIYLNVHWTSDVIAGFSLGLFWLTLLILFLKVSISLRDSSHFRDIRRNLKAYLKMAQAIKDDKRVPRTSKLLLGFALGYAFLPFDIVPDFIPVLGQIDDLLIIPLCIYLALKLIPPEVYKEHYRKHFA